ncbi:pentatricopeptide repeat-containing protein At2g03380, mitochondrial [Dioscorea cayenensis subsp. rotundata]|uniref:Pentatricopeptide repeat-containing protein At2g03380, mitochondrial n=1 Tax=Dioscorea cayennensis subsp. rotundata TaxID=55577 RepID=A0AB40BV94_DIOCR|nr:pentatricopeptide repeat-containing protein At2g03380, mitochondrial [Dioscorea cayenensis subsp. rotundata]
MESIWLYKGVGRHVVLQDNVLLSMLLKACAKLPDLRLGKIVHCDIIKFGSPDCFVINGLINLYVKCGKMNCSRRLFDGLQQRNVVSWTNIISGLIQNDSSEEGLALFNQMRQENVRPSEYTVVSLLTGASRLGALHQGKWIHGCIVKNGICMNSFVGTGLLDMYVKCGEVIDARSVFDELCDVDLVSWTAMVVGYTQKGYPIDALELFADKKWAAIVPNSVTIASALSASAQLRYLFFGKLIHALGLKLGFEEYDVMKNALVDMYAKCSEMLEAKFVFESVLKKNVVTWNAMMAGYAQNNFGYECLVLFQQMQTADCSPDAITVVSVLSASACLGALQYGCSLHVYAMKHAFLSNVYVSTALLNFYNKCGEANSARLVFNEMNEKNTVTWCAMMGGHGVHGDSADSIALFGKMLEEELHPNHVTFTNILSACGHTGMVTEGQKYFDIMSRDHGITPSMKHYACMVDMLARAGQLEDALKFIERMPIKPGVNIWGAFLHGCRIHSRLDLGKMAAQRVIELHPETADYYALVSNFYALMGMWTEADNVRTLMKSRRLNKSPGLSLVFL